MGRLVISHSTYLDGLIPWLKALSRKDGIGTITPGVIKRSKGRSPTMQIKITCEIKGGYKLLARKGKTVQEVFLLSKLSKEDLLRKIKETKPKK